MKPKQVKQILLSEIKFDEKINLQLTRKQTKETKELFKRKCFAAMLFIAFCYLIKRFAIHGK